MSDLLRINTKFCVKLGKNASYICALPSEAYGGEDTKKSSVSEWHKRPKKIRMLKTQMKTLLITFFDIKGTAHFEVIPQTQTVNQAYYVEILKRLGESMFKKKGLLCGSMTGFFTMTMFPLTGRSPSRS
jgi:hypothetical protein